MCNSMDDPKSVVFHKGTRTLKTGNATVTVIAPTDITLEHFSRIAAPLIDEAYKKGILPKS